MLKSTWKFANIVAQLQQVNLESDENQTTSILRVTKQPPTQICKKCDYKRLLKFDHVKS